MGGGGEGVIRKQRSKIRDSNMISTAGGPFLEKSRNSSVERFSTLAGIAN